MVKYSMNPVNSECTLWVGAEPPPGYEIGRHFDVLVLAASEIQDPRMYPGVKKILTVPLDDCGKPPTAEEVYLASKAGAEVAKQIARGKTVLSTCHLGLNRSSLIAALALRNLGWGPDRTINTIRRARGANALSNRWFEEIVRVY